MQGSASLWLTGRSGRLSSEATLDPSSTGDQAVTLARSDASAAEEASFIVEAASSLAGKLRVRSTLADSPSGVLALLLWTGHVFSVLNLTRCVLIV